MIVLCSLVLSAMMLVTAGVVWVTQTEQGLRFAAAQAQDWVNSNSDQQLEFGRFQGTLWRGFDLEFVRW